MTTVDVAIVGAGAAGLAATCSSRRSSSVSPIWTRTTTIIIASVSPLVMRGLEPRLSGKISL
jgi:NADH dehydrogenase FAD-containing subunit